MRKGVLFLAIMAVAMVAVAQESVDATAEYYRRQFVKIQKIYVEKPDDVAVNIDLARFYSQNDNPMRNLPTAMEHIAKAENMFVEIVSDMDRSKEGRQLIKQKITIAGIRQLKQQIVAQARQDVSEGGLSDAQKDAYIVSFGDDASIGRQIKKQRLENAYESARETNTVEAYYRFMLNYQGTSEAESAESAIAQQAPRLFDGVQSPDAVEKIASRYSESPSVQRQAEKCKSKMAFAAAQQKHTVEGYKAFIADHPSSDEYTQALEILDNLRMHQYQRLSTPEEYADFISANSDDPLAERAMATLREMVGKDHDAVAAKIYLKRFLLDPQHSQLYQEYYHWISAEGNRQPIEAFAKEHPDYPFPNEVNEDLKQSVKIDAFPLNSPFVEADFASYASFVRMNSEKRIALVALQRSLQRLCAQRDWKKALTRMESLELAFDNAYKSNFVALRKIVSTAPDKRTLPIYESSPSYNLVHPVPHPDGHHLYYTRCDNGESSICVSIKSESKKGPRWGLAEPIRFSNIPNQGVTIYGFYEGGNKMVLGKDGDILFAVREDSLWRIAEVPSYPLNTDYQETDAYMLPDGSGLLMASDRPSGYNFQPSRSNFHGDTALATDLYFVPFGTQGWGTPVNLGSKINTCYAERSPILSGNLKTLYFVSDGHVGLGYGDVFMSTRADIDSWTEWSTPVHLGREANTGYDESSVALSSDESRLYISSNSRGGRYGCYSVGTLHDTTHNHRVLAVDISSLEGSLMSVDVLDAEHYKVRQSVLYPDADTIYITLTKGRKYVLMVDASHRFVPGVTLFNDTLSVLLVRGYTMEELLTMDQPLPMPLVSFEKMTPQLQSHSVVHLDRLVDFLKEYQDCRVLVLVDVSGHNDKQCYELAGDCGQSVRRYLMGQGIGLERVGVVAYGNTRCRQEKNNAISVSLRFSKIQ